MTKSTWFWLVFASCFGCAPALLSRPPAEVQGRVEDPKGSAVVQAAVKLTPQSGGEGLKAATDDTGRFVFAGVPPGKYVLAVKADGFKKAESRLQVGSDPVPEQTIRLKVEDVKEELSFSARSDDLIAPDENAAAVHLDSDLLKSLPAKYDDVLKTASLFVESAANDAAGTKIVVDGVESTSLDVPASSVKTISVNSNPYSTEFSRPGKGRIEVATRGGSLRRFHNRFTV